MTALDEARAVLGAGLTEDAGPNTDHAGVITEMLREVGAGPGEPWCAAFATRCFRVAGGAAPAFASASSQGIRRWFEDHGLLNHDAQALLKWRGALFGWTDADGAHGHIGLVSGRLTAADPNESAFAGSRVIGIETIEGNASSGGGERPIEGVFSHRRTVPESCGHALWFCNTSDLPGGAWWAAN